MLDPMCGLGTILLEAATEWPVSIAVVTGRSLPRFLVVVPRKNINLCHSYNNVH